MHIFIYSYIHIFIYSYIHVFMYSYIHMWMKLGVTQSTGRPPRAPGAPEALWITHWESTPNRDQ